MSRFDHDNFTSTVDAAAAFERAYGEAHDDAPDYDPADDMPSSYPYGDDFTAEVIRELFPPADPSDDLPF